jgi:hypothetical protein
VELFPVGNSEQKANSWNPRPVFRCEEFQNIY